MSAQRHRILLFVLATSLPFMAIWHLSSGQVAVEFSDFTNTLLHFDPSQTEHLLVREFRFPRLIMALISGSGLAICGMLMQTLFKNPLAGPYVLGINSGASLAVATGMLTGFNFLQTDLGIVSLALLGAFVFGLVILLFSSFLRNSVSLLLVGIMIGSFTSAITALMQSISSAESLKSFTMWGMGSLQQVELDQTGLILIIYLIGVVFSFLLIKALNTLVLGEDAAQLLGIKTKTIRILIVSVTALLAGLITAYCGPIAFVGLAIPNLSRIIFRTQDHLWLLLANILLGAHFILFCDILIQQFEHVLVIPINVITSIIGAPFILFVIVKRMV